MGYLKILPHQSNALKEIAKIPAGDFQSIVSTLIETSEPSIRSSEFFEAVKKASEDQKFSIALCSQLISLATFRRLKKINTEELFDALLDGMKRADVPEEVIGWYDEVKVEFIRLLDSESVKLPSKALYLSTDFDLLYASANVVTDVRPVFNGDQTTVAGAIVAQTLRIQYVGGVGKDKDQQISLALDLDDIEKLIAELKKAKQKAEFAKKQFGELMGSDIFVIGEETYGFG